MRKNRLIALIGTLTMAAAGLAAVSAGVSSKKADSVSAWTTSTLYVKGDFNSWGNTKLNKISNNDANVLVYVDGGTSYGFKMYTDDDGGKWLADSGYGFHKDWSGPATLNGSGENNMTVNANVAGSGKRVELDFHFYNEYSGQNNKLFVYQKEAFKVTFNSNGGSSVSSIEKGSGASISKPTDPTKSGATFGGWYTDSGFSTAAEWPLTLNSNKTLYAKWLADSYTVAFNNNGGSGTMNSIVTEVGNTTAVPSCTFTAPAGYKFKEWNSQADGMGDTYDSTHPVPSQTKDTTKTVYAIWQEFDPHNGYWIQFYTKDAKRTGNMVPLVHDGNQWTALGTQLYKDEVFKIVNYASEVPFEWYGIDQCYEKGAAEYGQLVSDGTPDKNFKVVFDGAYDFYFHDDYTTYKVDIKPIKYQVTYHANNSKGESDFVIHPNVGYSFNTAKIGTGEADAKFTAPTGMVFKGWNTKADGTGDGHNVNEEMLNGTTKGLAQNENLDLYAMWGEPVEDGMYMRGSWNWTAAGQIKMTADESVDKQYVAKGIRLNSGDEVKAVGYTDNYESWIEAKSTTMDGSGYSASFSSSTGNAILTGDEDHPRGVFNIYVKTDTGAYNFYALRVNYHANGGTGTMDPDYPVDNGFYTEALANEFTAPSADKKFSRWCTTADGKGDTYNVGDPINFYSRTEDLNLYALWEDKVTVSYYVDDELYTTRTGFYNDSIQNVPDVPSKTGYAGSWDKDLTVFPDTNTSVNAVYEGNEHTVTFDVQGGTLVGETATATYGSETPSPDRKTNKTGYDLQGFYSQENGGGTKYLSGVWENGKYESVHDYDIDDDATLYAYWTVHTFTLSFDLGDAEGYVDPVDNVDIEYGAKLGSKYPDLTDKWEGHTFDGWYYEGTDPATLITADTPYTAPINITAVAHWSEIATANVILNVVGEDYGELDVDGALTGLPVETEVYVDADGILYIGEDTIVAPFANDTDKNYYYTFDGWTGIPSDGELPAGETTITATFTRHENPTITIGTCAGGSIQVTGGTSPITVPYGSEVIIDEDEVLVSYNDLEFSLTLKALANSTAEYTYAFEKWNNIEEGEFTSSTTITADFTPTPVNYQLTWDFNGGTPAGEYTYGSVAYGTAITYPTDVTGKTGYTFAGWNKTLATMPAEATTITALFTANSYDVTFNANGGKFSDESPRKDVSETYDAKYQLPENPSYDGYSFQGWFTDPVGGTQVTTDSDVKITAAQTLYAHWTASTYTVTFNKQSGTGGSDSVTATYNSTMPSAEMPSREGYTFLGYFDAASGGTKYYNANGSSAKEWDKASDTTLYAQWSANPYNVTFDANGGKFSDESTTKVISETYDAKYQLPENPSYDGYSFQGWFTESTGGTQVTTETDVKITGVQTLYAHWSITPKLEADQFASKFLDAMNGVCDEDGKTKESELASKWSEVFTSDDWKNLSADAKAILKDTKADSESTDLTEKFGASYNYIYGKYHISAELTDYAERNPSDIGSGSRLISINDVSTSTWIIASVAIVGIAAVGVFFIYRKRKEN